MESMTTQGLIERFPGTTEISDRTVPEDQAMEKGASINVNFLNNPNCHAWNPSIWCRGLAS